jgi:predicted DNA-binding transcriptional regulator AlpA
MEDKLLNRLEVARLLAITENTFDKLRKEGFAAPVRVGKRDRWRACDVAAWIESNILKNNQGEL